MCELNLWELLLRIFVFVRDVFVESGEGDALFLQLTRVKARVGFLIWFALFRYLECGEALWKYPAYTLWISSSCFSSEQLAAFNSECLSAGEPCVVGRRKYSVSSTSQLRSWAPLGAPWEPELCFSLMLGRPPELWFRRMLFAPLQPLGEFLVSAETFRKWKIPRVRVLCGWWFIVVL